MQADEANKDERDTAVPIFLRDDDPHEVKSGTTSAAKAAEEGEGEIGEDDDEGAAVALQKAEELLVDAVPAAYPVGEGEGNGMTPASSALPVSSGGSSSGGGGGTALSPPTATTHHSSTPPSEGLAVDLMLSPPHATAPEPAEGRGAGHRSSGSSDDKDNAVAFAVEEAGAPTHRGPALTTTRSSSSSHAAPTTTTTTTTTGSPGRQGSRVDTDTNGASKNGLPRRKMHDGGVGSALPSTSPSPSSSLAARQHELTTPAATAAAGTAPRPKAKPRRRFAAGSKDTFFFDRERLHDIGVGTVGLYAAKAVPVASDTYPGRSGKDRHVRSEEDGAGQEQETSGRTFYSSAFYSAPAHDFLEDWDRKEHDYAEWRSSRLSRSLFHTFGRTYPGCNSHHHHPSAERGEREEDGGCYPPSERGSGPLRQKHSDGPPLTFDACGLPVDAASFETDRLRAIATARQAKEEARAEHIEALSRDVLDRRHRKRHGEAVDLPAAYFERVREVFPDKGDPSLTTVADHRCACQAQRLHQRQQRELTVEQRRGAAHRMRTTVAEQLKQSKAELAEYQAEITHGLPRISREAAAAKRDEATDLHCEQARLCRAERDANRRLYAQLADDQNQAEQTRQRELQAKVGRVAAHTGGAGVRSGGGAADIVCTSAAPVPASLAEAKAPEGTAAPVDASSSSHSPPPLHSAPVTATATTTNFFAEVKTWQQRFQSPNPAPVTGADGAVRRDWLQRLEDDRRALNKETVSIFREEQPAKLQSAREAHSRHTVLQAEAAREEARELSRQRTAAEEGRRRHTSSIHDAQRRQQLRVRAVRDTQTDDRRQRAELLKERERQSATAAAQREAEEREYLRHKVAATRE